MDRPPLHKAETEAEKARRELRERALGVEIALAQAATKPSAATLARFIDTFFKYVSFGFEGIGNRLEQLELAERKRAEAERAEAQAASGRERHRQRAAR